MSRAAAITGVGPVSAIGSGAATFWQALTAGTSGTRALTRFAPPRRGCAVAAEVADPAPAPPDAMRPQPRAVQLALAAARLALADAGWSRSRAELGVIVGNGVGNLDLLEQALDDTRAGKRLPPSAAFRAFSHAAACELVRELDIGGPSATISTGCNSGADALGMALDWIRLGRAPAVLVGGCEAELTPGFFALMSAARALAVRFNDAPARASRPFDRDRDGNVPGEGAGFLVVESLEHARARDARVRATLAGYAARSAGRRPDYDPFNPVFHPEPMARTLAAALADAGVAPAAVSAISANGSSSVFYDAVEAAALRTVFGESLARVPVHSTKSMLGQTGAATPALQAIAAALSVEAGVIPPTINVDALDERCPLDVVRGEPRRRALDYVLANATGFGGFYFSAFVIGRAG
jgi:3-oxoacyl-(acyl-carrier-protein) synthase